MPSNKSQRPGFTIVEMIIVIAIIGILSTLAFLSLNILRSRIRDVKRLNDVAQIQKALEYYANDHTGQYPDSTEFKEGQTLKSKDGQTIYLNKIPVNELATGQCLQQPYIYRLGTNGQNYSLQYCLGFTVQDYQTGNCIALPGILCNQSDCSCNNSNKNCCGWCQQEDICIHIAL